MSSYTKSTGPSETTSHWCLSQSEVASLFLILLNQGQSHQNCDSSLRLCCNECLGVKLVAKVLF